MYIEPFPNRATLYPLAPARPALRPAPTDAVAEPAPSRIESLLARLVGEEVEAPEWLRRPVERLVAAANLERPLAARLADIVQLMTEVEQLVTTHLPEVVAWFQGPAAGRLALPTALPFWTETLLAEASVIARGRLLPELATAGIEVRPVVQVDEWQRAWLHRYFTERVYPLLTPLAVDPGRPFPYISSHSINLLVELRRPEVARNGSRSELFARVKVPSATPRLVAVPAHPAEAVAGSGRAAPSLYVSSADLVRFFVHHLFTGMPVRHVYLFRVVRGAMALPGANARAAARLRREERQPVVRLDVERRMNEPVLQWLTNHLQIPPHGIVRHEGLMEWMCLPHLLALLEQRRESAAERLSPI